MKLSASGLRSLGEELYWIEGRPELGGRRVALRQLPGGEGECISPEGLSLQSRVHEYGGGELAVVDDEGPLIVGVRADQALVAFRPGAELETVLLEANGSEARGDLAASRGLVVYVAEQLLGEEHRRSIRALVLAEGTVVELAAGRDFYASPRLSPDGASLVYSCWDHPEMPWEAAELWQIALWPDVGRLDPGRRLAGGLGQPASHAIFDAGGNVVLLLELEGFSRPVRLRADGSCELLGEQGVEYGGPIWSLGEEHLVAVGGRLAAIEQRGGLGHLVELFEDGSRLLCDEPSSLTTLAALPRGVAWQGSTAAALGAVGRVELDGASRVLNLGPSSPLAAEQISSAEPFEALAEDGRLVHGLLFRPRNGTLAGPEGSAPPVVVACHGGPTAQARAGFDPLVQLLTSRGFAVVAANYAGSTGFGADYRHRLDEAWGLADVEDCVALVRWLAERGDVDAGRAAIRGGSAGGFTALLGATTGAFAGTVSWYGVADLLSLAATTHDFEARYCDRLVGPLPQAAARYSERSPVNRATEMRGAVLLLQGLDDPVVPPAQSEAMAAALVAAGAEVELIEFQGEGHGFRRKETLVAAFDAELAFYERVLCPEAGGGPG
jgi:dienelactone hydrolase